MLSSTGNELRGKHNYYKYHNKPVAGKLWWASSLAEMRKRKMVLYVLPHLPGKDYSTALARIQLSQLIPFLKIEVGPPHAGFESLWSPQKARKFRNMQPTT